MEARTLGGKAAARKEAKGKRKAAREKPERVGRAARQNTLQLGARKGGNKNLWTKMTVRTSKSQLRLKRICRHDVYWKRVKLSSGRRCSADEANEERRKSIKRHC